MTCSVMTLSRLTAFLDSRLVKFAQHLLRLRFAEPYFFLFWLNSVMFEEYISVPLR